MFSILPMMVPFAMCPVLVQVKLPFKEMVRLPGGVAELFKQKLRAVLQLFRLSSASESPRYSAQKLTSPKAHPLTVGRA